MERGHAASLRRPSTLWVVATTILVAGCGAEYPGGRAEPANLVLITLDTTRADRLGCYGDAHAATPRLDRLAAEGALVERSIAVAPVTLPSHASLLTGLYPPRHGVRDNTDFRLPADVVTLAEHLGDRGYATAAVVGSVVLSAAFGLDQGFDSYDEPQDEQSFAPAGAGLRHEPILDRPAGEVTDRALELFGAGLSEPFFLWVHYFDPHMPYSPPEPWAQRFAGEPYAGEIAYTDAQIGRLLDDLERRGWLDDTLVAVTADHGESLGDHGEATHGLFIYDATLRVPMLLRLPGAVPPGARVERLASGVDLAPTLLELLGQPAFGTFDGRSFAAALDGGPEVEREPVYAEAQLPRRAYGWSPLFALHGGNTKFVEAPEPELYDLLEDPGELRNLAGADPARLDDWSARLEALRASWPPPTDAAHALDPAARQRLATLGYLSAAGPAAERAGGIDPKGKVAVHNRLLDVQPLIARGDIGSALVELRNVLDDDPGNPAALAQSGTLLCTADRCDEGIPLLADAARRSPGVHQTQRNLANALHLAGRLEQAAATYRAAIALRPDAAEDRYALGNVLFGLGDLEGAIEAYRTALALAPGWASLHAALGAALDASGDPAGSERALLRAVEADPGLADGWNRLGILAEKAGDTEGARDRYDRALEASPDHAGALFGQAKVSLQLGDLEAARAGVTRLVTAHPGSPAGRYLEAQILLALGDEPAARLALERFLAQETADPRLVKPARDLLRQIDG